VAAKKKSGISSGIPPLSEMHTATMKRNLTDTATRNAKHNPDGTPHKHTDGGGMYLLVTATGKYWRYDYRFLGKRKTLAIGLYPDVTLKDARALHDEARSLLAKGIDPSNHKQVVRATQAAKVENTFETVALEWFSKNLLIIFSKARIRMPN
jgi:single-stranded DNA-specific DHH superfamily exonuclease